MPRPHSGGGPLLSRKNVLSSCVPQRAIIFPANSMLPIRRPGEGRGPVTLTIFKSLGPGLRRNDGAATSSTLLKTKKLVTPHREK